MSELIGKEYGTNKGTILTIVRLLPKIKGKNIRVVVTCSKCSLDKELFPEPFESYKSNLDKKKAPCGCGKSPRWNENQYKLRLQREFKETAYTFTSFKGEFEGAHTKCVCYCSTCAKSWDTSKISHLLDGIGCPSCGKREMWEKRADEQIHEGDTVINKHGVSLKVVKKDVKAGLFYVTCEECYKRDPELWKFPIRVHGGCFSRSGCCDCSGNVAWTEYQTKLRTSRAIQNLDSNSKLVRFSSAYKGNKTKVYLDCPLHGAWFTSITGLLDQEVDCSHCRGCARTTLESFLVRCNNVYGNIYDYSKVDYKDVDTPVEIICKEHGSFKRTPYDHTNCERGCPSCIVFLENQVFCYIHEILYNDGDVLALKYGKAIDVHRRCIQQQNKCIHTIQTKGVWKFPDRVTCGKAEFAVKSNLNKEYLVPKIEMLDGFSETTSVDNLDMIISTYESYGGVLVK